MHRLELPLLGAFATVMLLSAAVANGCAGDRRGWQRSHRSVADATVLASSATIGSWRASFVRTVQQAAGDDFFLRPLERDRWVADNAAQGITVELGYDGVTLRDEGRRGAGLTLRPARYGTASSEPPDVVVHRNRLALQHMRDGQLSFDEAYVNGPLGVEQIFVVHAQPVHAGDAVVITVPFHTPLAAELSADGRAVRFGTGGRTNYTYGDLYVEDASGTVLPATLELQRDAIAIRVEATAATFPLLIDPLIWAESGKLVAADGVAGDRLGAAVAVDGDYAVVGAPERSGGGAAYVFVRDGVSWTEQQALTASDVVDGARFGAAVAIADATVIVGAPDADAVYAFVRTGESWAEQAKLVAQDTESGDGFGVAVALAGDVALIGAPATSPSGGAYVFGRSGASWAEQASLPPSLLVGTRFGASVALAGSTAVVGAPHQTTGGAGEAGAAHVFVQSGAEWVLQDTLGATDAQAGDEFGFSVALAADVALIGAHLDDTANTDAGSAYVFVRADGDWMVTQKLTPAEVSEDMAFGASVAIDGERAVIGGTGVAITFTDAGTDWVQDDSLLGADTVADDELGAGVSISATTVLVGAPAAAGIVPAAGSSYAFLFAGEPGDSCVDGIDCHSGSCVEGCCDAPCEGPATSSASTGAGGTTTAGGIDPIPVYEVDRSCGADDIGIILYYIDDDYYGDDYHGETYYEDDYPDAYYVEEDCSGDTGPMETNEAYDEVVGIDNDDGNEPAEGTAENCSGDSSEANYEGDSGEDCGGDTSDTSESGYDETSGEDCGGDTSDTSESGSGDSAEDCGGDTSESGGDDDDDSSSSDSDSCGGDTGSSSSGTALRRRKRPRRPRMSLLLFCGALLAGPSRRLTRRI